MSKMYNPKYKTKFIEDLNDIRIERQYNWLFDRSFDFETTKFGKDLFDFNEEQLLDFLQSLNLSIGSINSYTGYIRRYTKWANENNLKTNNKIAADHITNELRESIAKPNEIYHVDFIYELVGKTFANNKEPKYYLKQLDNIQDQLLVYLAFLGVRGNGESELLNLTIGHVDFDKKILKLSELNPLRKDIPIDDYALNLIRQSRNEAYYYRRVFKNEELLYNKLLLSQTPYIFRGAERSDNRNDGILSKQALTKRIKGIADYIGYPLTLKKIEYAGKLYVASMLEKNGENLDARNPIIQRTIFDRYNMSVVNDNAERKHLDLIKKLKEDLKTVYEAEEVSEVN